ncbi:MAG: hypothetical protein QUU85_18800 [Candidatus Eisenbacteria bacterium]|nr:hypothetical protein [Candidatus Eisenbacteria bacterium]
MRMRWADPTDSRARSPERIADAGDSTIYKAHSLDIERFADAACVMFPQNVQNAQDAASFPSLMMGDAAHPVDLYYWHGTRGFERLIAAGRGTTTRTGQAIPGSVRRTADGWECVFQIPPAAAGTPIAFAVWDGEKQQRDGLKFYSVWYELREIGGAP